ncbi:hypothetical protein CABS03_13153 [Colletotrichum abscissum]
MCEEILFSHLVAEDDSGCTLVNVTPHYPESLSMRYFLEKFVEASDEFFEVDFSLSTSSVQTAFIDSWPVDISDENGAGEATLCTLGASSRLKERRNMMNKYQESDIVEYEDGVDCEAFDNTDFLWEETARIGLILVSRVFWSTWRRILSSKSTTTCRTKTTISLLSRYYLEAIRDIIQQRS